MDAASADANEQPEFQGPLLPPWPALVLAGRRLSSAVAEIALPDHRVTLLSARPYQMPTGWSMRAHEHSFYEASVLLAGVAQADAPIAQPLAPGHVFLHPPHRPHAWSAPETPCLRWILWFTVEPPVPIPLPTAWPRSPEILQDTAQLLWTLAEADAGWRDLAAARLACIAARLLTLGDLPARDADPPTHPDTLVSAVETFLADNLRRPIHLEDIASHLGVSPSSLTHRYRRLTGGTVGQRLAALRLERAAQLLTTTTWPLPAICDAVGITDPPYLCRLFLRYFLTTPGQYRARQRQQG